MAHWGWYWRVKLRHISKTLCSDMLELDSFWLFRHKDMGGFNLERHQLEVRLNHDKSSFNVSYGKAGRTSYQIPVEKQRCNFGGYRYYFRCPLCECRMRKLYCNQGVFLCRNCLNLGYETQRLRKSKRHLYMKEKVEAQLQHKGGDLYKKPKWMRQEAYEKMKDCYWDHEAKSWQAADKELREYFPNKPESFYRW